MTRKQFEIDDEQSRRHEYTETHGDLGAWEQFRTSGPPPLFRVYSGRLAMLCGANYVLVVDVMAGLDRLIDSGLSSRTSAYETLSMINQDFCNRAAIPSE